jgi:hypothetical protein
MNYNALTFCMAACAVSLAAAANACSLTSEQLMVNGCSGSGSYYGSLEHQSQQKQIRQLQWEQRQLQNRLGLEGDY